MKTVLLDIYKRLYGEFGPQYWWPGRTRFEVIVGAILTQNTSWTNVEKAIRNLKREKLLTPESLSRSAQGRIAGLIRPSGYYNIKTARIKNFLEFLNREYAGSLTKMFRAQDTVLREKLLAVKGIGPETADSILLYAGNKPVFVIDAYTRRIFSRHGMAQPDIEYGKLQEMFMAGLPRDAGIYNEYHALIVRVGKDLCRTRPRCDVCPLKGFRAGKKA